MTTSAGNGGWLTTWRTQLGRRLITVGKALASEVAVAPEVPPLPTQREPETAEEVASVVPPLLTQAQPEIGAEAAPEVPLPPAQAQPETAAEVTLVTCVAP